MSLPLSSLLDRVSSALRGLPGATALVMFGSAADPARCDAWSDLDLQVASQDYVLSRAAWPWILQGAGAIALAYPISEQPGESAFSIALAGESLYHKIDVSLSAAEKAEALLPAAEKRVVLWRQTALCKGPILAPGGAFVPAPGSAAHFLTGELLSAVRYVKARKRSQHLACWRFLSAKFNALLRCYAWSPQEGREAREGNEQNFPQTVLTTWDFTALDRALPESERLELLAGLELHTPAAMDRALLALIRQIAGRLAPEYQTDPDPLSRLAREYIEFIGQELASPSA